MEEWQKRLIDERDDLEIKLSKLSQYLGKFKGEYLSECIPVERYNNTSSNLDLLFRQQRIMLDYHQILTQRICLFKGN